MRTIKQLVVYNIVAFTCCFAVGTGVIMSIGAGIVAVVWYQRRDDRYGRTIKDES